MKLETVARPSLVETVAGSIRDLIERRKLQAGDRLPTEPEMIADLGCSRTVLREAIGRLEMIGLLTIQHGRGMFVGDPKTLSNCAKLVRSAVTISPRDWIKFAQFRAAIEIESARLAAQHGSDEEFAALEKILEEMDRPDQTYMDSVRTDFRFHLKIVEMSGNELMRNTMEVIQEFVISGMVQTTDSPRDHARSQRLHREIFEAVRSGDPEKAERVMREHMNAIDVAIRRTTGFSEQDIKG